VEAAKRSPYLIMFLHRPVRENVARYKATEK
jgi:hypothetical protein